MINTEVLFRGDENTVKPSLKSRRRKCTRLAVFAIIAWFATNTHADSSGSISSSAEGLVSSFYLWLLSDKPVSECPDLFVESESFFAGLPEDLKKQFQNKPKVAAVWHYLRSRKDAFLFSGVTPAETVKRAWRGYFFTAWGKGRFFFEGNLSVVLYGRFSEGPGVVKQIMFPLEKIPGREGCSYRISLFALTVNGVVLDPLMDGKRTGNFYQQLGMEPKP